MNLKQEELNKAPNKEEDEASLAGLALAPMVAERAAIEKKKHYQLRRGETSNATVCKVGKWNKNLFNPQGGR